MTTFTPVTLPELLQSSALARRRDNWRMQGVVFAVDDLPRINELLAHRAAQYSEFGGQERLAELRTILDSVAGEIIASGVVRDIGPVVIPDASSPDPDVWANGTVLQRVSETVLRELDEDAAIASIANWAQGGPQIREVTGLGWLYTEKEMSELTTVTVSTLRNWRASRKNFEFVKFGPNGTLRYTERGIRAFFEMHVQRAE